MEWKAEIRKGFEKFVEQVMSLQSRISQSWIGEMEFPTGREKRVKGVFERYVDVGC